MKSIAILLILLAAVGGWYYYDKYGMPVSNAPTEDVADARVLALSVRAEKLFPTKEDERKAWLARQISAMQAIDRKAEGLDAAVFSSIVKTARDRYGTDYVKQLDFVSGQRVAALDVANMLANSGFSAGEKAALEKRTKEAFGNDYVLRRAVYSNIFEAYANMKKKSVLLSPEDYKKLSEKLMPTLLRNPQQALEIFERQALARHNFKTKSIPESYGDLRKDIEEKFPDDYVAQLAELDSRLDSAMRRGRVLGWGTAGRNVITPIAREYFAKYLYVHDANGVLTLSFVAKIRGKKVVAFPTCALDSAPKSYSVDLGGGKKISSNKIYLSKNADFGIILPDGIDDVSEVETEQAPKGKIAVEIVGVDLSGSQISFSAFLENGKFLEFEPHVKKAIGEKLRSGAIIVDSESKKAVGLLEFESDGGASYYADFENPTVEIAFAQKKRVSRWYGLGEALSFGGKICIPSETKNCRVVPFSELETVVRYDAAKFSEQKDNIRKLCRSNFSALAFMLGGCFGEDMKTEIVSAVAEKYNPTFVNGSRMNVAMLHMRFNSYMRDVRQALVQNVHFARSDFYSEYYFPFRETAKKQSQLFAKLCGAINGGISSQDKMAVLHADLAESLNGNTYVPPGRNFKRGGFGSEGGGGSVLKMENRD